MIGARVVFQINCSYSKKSMTGARFVLQINCSYSKKSMTGARFVFQINCSYSKKRMIGARGSFPNKLELLKYRKQVPKPIWLHGTFFSEPPLSFGICRTCQRLWIFETIQFWQTVKSNTDEEINPILMKNQMLTNSEIQYQCKEKIQLWWRNIILTDSEIQFWWNLERAAGFLIDLIPATCRNWLSSVFQSLKDKTIANLF